MKKLILLFFFIFIPLQVWGNENKNTNIIESIHLFNIDHKKLYSFGLHINQNEDNLHQCQNFSTYERNQNVLMQNTMNPFCNHQYIQDNKTLFLGIEILKKDSKNRFTVSLQGGFNFGIQNEKRKDGTQKIRVHANIKGKYDWGFINGNYKGVFRFVTPGSTPYNYQNNDIFSNHLFLMQNRDSKKEGLILNKDIYIGVELSF